MNLILTHSFKKNITGTLICVSELEE